MQYYQRIETKLTEAFSPTRLVIDDQSAKHAGHLPSGPGHAPVDGGGETHFSVEIVSPAFAGRNRVERQRLVYDVLASELKERVHALALRCLAPGE